MFFVLLQLTSKYVNGSEANNVNVNVVAAAHMAGGGTREVLRQSVTVSRGFPVAKCI